MPHINLDFVFPERAELLCIGAHCDDIEIGCGGTILRLLELHPAISITWLILTGNERRQAETRESARQLTGDTGRIDLILHQFRDGYLPYNGNLVKDAFNSVKAKIDPHLILSHWNGDSHQDHRFVSEMTWSSFRNSLILEYEIPKYDGDLGQPNIYVPLSDGILEHKVNTLMKSYGSQLSKAWFDEETFRSIHRLRGIESGSNSRYAEGFYCRKAAVLG